MAGAAEAADETAAKLAASARQAILEHRILDPPIS
jgi:hypothetical protein